MEPVSGNWCWIAENPRYLRYVLGHGWRYSIFLAVIVIYAYIFMRVGHRVRSRRRTNTTAATPSNAEADPPLPFSPNVQRFDVKRTDGLQSLESELSLNILLPPSLARTLGPDRGGMYVTARVCGHRGHGVQRADVRKS